LAYGKQQENNVALTKGFKRVASLLVIVGIVGGGLYGYRQYSKQHQQQSDWSNSTSNAGQSSVNYSMPSSQPLVEQATQAAVSSTPEISPGESPTSAPAVQLQDSAPSNSGMAALLNAGKKKQ
jgi:hypothetical protein